MIRTLKILVTMSLVLGFVWSASADDDPKVSFKFNLEWVTVSITGIDPDALHDEKTKRMLQRAAQLVHYSAKQMGWQKDFPRCLRRKSVEEQESTTTDSRFDFGDTFGECVEWEK